MTASNIGGWPSPNTVRIAVQISSEKTSHNQISELSQNTGLERIAGHLIFKFCSKREIFGVLRRRFSSVHD